MELPKNFEYFEKTSLNKTIENLIKEQGDNVCQQKIGVDYIKNQLTDYSFGFIRYTTKAQVGQRRTRLTEHHLYSFVLCKHVPDPLVKEYNIILVCSRANSKDGKLLMQLVEQKARELHYQRLSLIAVGDQRLLHWYESLGYISIDHKPIQDSNNNAYYMRKYL
jgi:hypothetical protein